MIQLGGEVLHNILIEIGIHMKLVKLIHMCSMKPVVGPGRQTFVWHVFY